MRGSSGRLRLRLVLVALIGLLLVVLRAGGAAACHSTCARQLVECKRTCPGDGPARRECRTACAEQSTCTAPGARIRTLGYVVTECSRDSQGRVSGGQKLVIRRGNCDPVTVMELPTSSIRPEAFDLCLGPKAGTGSFFRSGDVLAPETDVFQRAGVLPDGSGMVFEVTNDLSLRPDLTPEPPEKGIFFIATGKRRPQLTHLPATPAVLSCLAFLDNRTLTFCTRVYTPAIDTFLITDVFIVRTDGTPEEKVPVIALPGGGVVPVFTIFGSRTRAAVTVGYYPATPVDRFATGLPIIEEVFLLDGKDVLQLTNFRRSDTARAGRGGALAGQRVFFEASANPLRTNPGENCQVFSIDIRGGDLRQLTRLRDRGHPSGVGCFTANPASCSIERISAISLQAPSPSRRAAIPSGGTHPGIRPSACAPTARDCAS